MTTHTARLLALLALSLAAALGAEPASASTVAIESFAPQVLVFRGAPGEWNAVTFSKRQTSQTTAVYVVEDPDNTLTPGNGCSVASVDPPQVECDAAGATLIDVRAGDGVDTVVAANGLGTGPNKLTRFDAELGTGDDYYVYNEDVVPDVVYGEEGKDTLTGGGADDLIDGGEGNDIATLNGGDDEFHGGPGNDVGIGGDGADSFEGAEGDDQLFGEDGPDFADGGPGDDILDLSGGGDDEDEGLGGTGKDLLRSGAGDDVVDGGEGDDDVASEGGSDEVSGGPGDDYLFAGAGFDLEDGGPGNDGLNTLENTRDPDFYVGGEGTDTVIYTSGSYVEVTLDQLPNDGHESEIDWVGPDGDVENVSVSFVGEAVLVGDDGPNTLAAFSLGVGAGLFGEGGDDRLIGSDKDDVADGGPGADVLRLDAGFDLAYSDDGGSLDKVDCGADEDEVHADWADELTACEDASITALTAPVIQPPPIVKSAAPKRASIAVSSKAATARVTATGSVRLPLALACPGDNGAACKVTAMIRTTGAVKAGAGSTRRARRLTLARSKSSVAPGSSQKVRLRLSRRGRAALKRLRVVKVVVTVSIQDHLGGQTKTLKIKLRAPKKR